MIRMLHAADLHLDSPFAGLNPEQAAARRALQRQLPEQIAALCRDHDCQLLLLAGDVFDGRRVCPETVQALRDALGSCGAQVFVAPGNHDPYTGESPWAMTRWPDNVHIFAGKPESVTLPELGCRVWGGGFVQGECWDPLPVVESDGLLEIGVYHGDPETPGSYRYISGQDLARCGLDYLALGHIHRTQLPMQVGKTWCGWPGVTMGRGFDECGVHGVFLTELGRDHCQTRLIPLAGPRYEKLTVALGTSPTLPADSNQVICRLTITGEGEPPDLQAVHALLKDRFLSLELRDETTPPPDLWASCGDGSLRGMAMDILKRRWDDGDTKAAALAARYVLAALEGREAP